MQDKIGLINGDFISQVDTIIQKKKRILHLVYHN
jgi:hypothetical protein